MKAESSRSGLKATKVAAPTRISGAVSPIARDSARITPVAMPGIAAGRTWRQIVCHWVAPSAIEPSRIDGGTARIASRAAMITTGSTSSPSVRPPASTTLPELERAAHEEGEAEDAVDDRRDRGEVLDVDLDRSGSTSASRSAYSSR